MTRLLFVKLLRDLRGAWERVVLMILAMSITLVMFSTGIVHVGRRRPGDRACLPEY